MKSVNVIRKKSFENMTVNEIIYLFNKPVRTVLSSYIPREVITCNKSDLPFINNRVKQLIQVKSKLYKCHKGSSGKTKVKLFNFFSKKFHRQTTVVKILFD